MLRWESDESGICFGMGVEVDEVDELAQCYSGKIEQTSDAY